MPSPSGSSSHERRQLGSQSVGQPSSDWKLPGATAMDRAFVVGDPVALVVVVELHVPARREVERDVRAARVQTVALGPRVVQGRFVLVAASRQCEGLLPDVVACVVGEVRLRTIGLPVARAAELGLQRPGDRHRSRIRRVRRTCRRNQQQRHSSKRDRRHAKLPHNAPPTPIRATIQRCRPRLPVPCHRTPTTQREEGPG
jgi:hypothetical protein